MDEAGWLHAEDGIYRRLHGRADHGAGADPRCAHAHRIPGARSGFAFRTKKVPELFFGLLRDKLTRQQFYALTSRGMTFSFIGFLALLPLAVTSQVLSHWTQPNALTLSDLQREL